MVIQNAVVGLYSEHSMARTIDFHSAWVFAAAFVAFNVAFTITVIAKVRNVSIKNYRHFS